MATYADKEFLGVGGFGEVWSCIREQDNEVFAKKRLRADAEDEMIKRFVREVRIISSLDHPNIIKVIGMRLTNPPYFYIMPLYETSLEAEIPRLKGDEARIRNIFGKVLDAIEYLHVQGIIHRDLTSRNILLNNDDDVVVSDFGLGRRMDSESTRITQTGYGLGTALYMAPEQIKSAKHADARSDIYSLGRILYEMYTGPLSIAIQDLSKLPSGPSFLIGRCTRAIPDDRFQSVTDLKNAWGDLYHAFNRESELEELAYLRAELAAPGEATRRKVERIVELVRKYSDDDDLIHETLMKLSSDSIDKMYGLDPAAMKQVIRRFVNFTAEQSWGFSYTDGIENCCKGIFSVITDYEMRAMLVRCAMEVGVRHNRWHVLGIFSDLFENLAAAGGQAALIEELKESTDFIRKGAAEYLNLNRLDKRLRELFES